MDFIKGILIFFVFLIFVKIGSIYSKKYISRASQLEQMKNLLNIFKVKIKLRIIFQIEKLSVIWFT